MQWWQTLLVAAVPVLITSVSLIAQQRFNSSATARADKERRLDAVAEREHQERLLVLSNEHARGQADEEYKRKTRDEWKADRVAAHTKLLTELERLRSEVHDLEATVGVELKLKRDRSEEIEIDLPEINDEWVAEVALICSDSSARAARKARSDAVMARVSATSLLIAMNMPDLKWDVEAELNRSRAASRNLDAALQAYRQAAKQDIGTVD